MAGKFKVKFTPLLIHGLLPFIRASRTGDGVVIGRRRPPTSQAGGGRSLDLRTTQRHEAEPAFKLTMVVENRPPHPYIRWIRWIRTMMQLCASRARLRSSSSPFFFPVQRPWGDGGLPLPRIAFGRFVAMRAEVPKPGISSSFLSPITPLNAA